VKPCNSREMKIKRVLLATHFEAGSTAPAHAALLCNEFSAELTILHVAEENKLVSPGRNRKDLAQQIASVVPAGNVPVAETSMHAQIRTAFSQHFGSCAPDSR
jgi:hypothetical protein